MGSEEGRRYMCRVTALASALTTPQHSPFMVLGGDSLRDVPQAWLRGVLLPASPLTGFPMWELENTGCPHGTGTPKTVLLPVGNVGAMTVTYCTSNVMLYLWIPLMFSTISPCCAISMIVPKHSRPGPDHGFNTWPGLDEDGNAYSPVAYAYYLPTRSPN